MMNDVKWFKALSILATLCRFELSDDVLEYYDTALSSFGYEALERATREMIYNRNTNDAFPSIKQFREALGEDNYYQIAGKILNSIRTHGRTLSMRDSNGKFHGHDNFNNLLIAEFGCIGAQVIKQVGGWQSLCESTKTKDLMFLQKTLSDMARKTNQNLHSEPETHMRAEFANRSMPKSLNSK